MAVGYRLPAGGLPSAAKALLTPENIRAGVHIKGGGVDVTGTIIPIACCFAAHISWSGGFIHEHVITDCGAGYIASAQSNVYGDGWIYTSCKVLKDFSGYQIIATSSAKAAKYNGIAISTSRDNPTNFVAGSSISFGSAFVEKRDVTDILCIALA